ncbi:hypothetical protein [Meiothermus sp.]|uniref:hypothetical protein n=1 Tax=Meiothermus sp. TaxID=1955249 RepID=UPI00262CCF6D|nr:hypothetical protein [Meiothermus sp.]
MNDLARVPDLSGIEEHFYLRPLLTVLRLEVMDETTHLGRPAVLLQGEPKSEAEIERLYYFLPTPEDWWRIADRYHIALDMQSGLLLYYKGFVKEGILVESEVLELDYSNDDASTERIFQV